MNDLEFLDCMELACAVYPPDSFMPTADATRLIQLAYGLQVLGDVRTYRTAEREVDIARERLTRLVKERLKG